MTWGRKGRLQILMNLQSFDFENPKSSRLQIFPPLVCGVQTSAELEKVGYCGIQVLLIGLQLDECM